MASVQPNLQEQHPILEAMVARYFLRRRAGVDYDPIPDAHLRATSFTALQIEDWTAKKRQGGPMEPSDADPTAPGTAGGLAFGEIHAVHDPEEKRHALNLIMWKYAPHLVPGRDYRPVTDAEMKRTAVHRPEVRAWSGKQESTEPDFPGAYLLPVGEPPLGDSAPAAAGSGARTSARANEGVRCT